MPGNGVLEQRPLLSNRITASSSVPEVVEFLRSSFQAKDFSLGLKILTDRENALKAEIENLKIANKSVRKEREIENLEIRGELKKLKRENEDLTENNAWLKQEIEELKAEKKEVEERLEASEKRFLELDGRVSRMEEDIAAGTGLKFSELRNIAENLDDELATEYDGLTFGVQNHLGPTVTTVGGSGPKKEEPYVVVVLSDGEDEMPMGSAEVLGKNEMRSSPQMNEEKGESLKRKRSIGNNDGDGSSFCTRKLKYTKQLVHETEVTPVFDSPKYPNRSDAGMSTYESIAGVKCEAIASPMACKSKASDTNLKPQKVGSRRWLDQNEMCLAFADDHELCMSAVCALYRKLISAPVSLKPMDRGFEPNDQLGVELAKYLIDGHPENKLNRSMSEVSKVAAEQSKMLALKYSGQLFRIYSSGEDPLFCHNSTSSKL